MFSTIINFRGGLFGSSSKLGQSQKCKYMVITFISVIGCYIYRSLHVVRIWAPSGQTAMKCF